MSSRIIARLLTAFAIFSLFGCAVVSETRSIKNADGSVTTTDSKRFEYRPTYSYYVPGVVVAPVYRSCWGWECGSRMIYIRRPVYQYQAPLVRAPIHVEVDYGQREPLVNGRCQRPGARLSSGWCYYSQRK